MVVAGAVATVAEEEPEDGMRMEEEVKVAGVEPADVPEVTETVGTGIEELLNIMEDVSGVEADVPTEVLEEVAPEGVSDDSEMGPGPRLNRKTNKFHCEWTNLSVNLRYHC